MAVLNWVRDEARKLPEPSTKAEVVGAHQDGKGFSVKLDYLPLNGGVEIVIREPRAEQAPGD